MRDFEPVKHHSWFEDKPSQEMAQLAMSIPLRVREVIDKEAREANCSRSSIAIRVFMEARPDWPWEYKPEVVSPPADPGPGESKEV